MDLNSEIWSANWQPMRQELDSWECRHGLGHTTITSTHKAVRTTITYLVTQKDPVELWLVKIKNLARQRRTLQVFPFVEFVVGDVALEEHYRNILALYNEAHYDEKLQTILAWKLPFKAVHKPGTTFFAASASFL